MVGFAAAESADSDMLLKPSWAISIPHDSMNCMLINEYKWLKECAWNAGDAGFIPGFGRLPGEGNGNPLQHSRLENPMDRGAWRAAVYGVAKS